MITIMSIKSRIPDLSGILFFIICTAAAEVIAIAKADPAVAPHVEGKTIVKEICVPNKIVNIVVR